MRCDSASGTESPPRPCSPSTPRSAPTPTVDLPEGRRDPHPCLRKHPEAPLGDAQDLVHTLVYSGELELVGPVTAHKVGGGDLLPHGRVGSTDLDGVGTA